MKEFEYVAITLRVSLLTVLLRQESKEAKSILDDEGLKPLNLVASKATNKKE